MNNTGVKRVLAILILLTTLACAVTFNPKEDTLPAEQTLEVLYFQDTLQAMQVTMTQVAETLSPDERALTDEMVLGEMDVHQARIFIPAGAFEGQNDVNLEALNVAPQVNVDGVQMLGKAISIKIDGDQLRSSEPIQLTLKFNNEGIQENGEVLVGYHHPDYGWELFSPDEIDLQRGELRFVTYHFSSFAAMRAEDRVRIEKYIERRSTEEFARRQAHDKSQAEFEQMVRTFMQEGMKVEDNRVIEIIVKGVVEQIPFTDIPYGNVAGAVYDFKDGGDKDLAKTTAETTMKYIGEKMLDEDNPFGEVTGDFGTVMAFGEAYVSIFKNDGDPQKALEIMADHIMSNIPVVSNFYKAGNRAIELAKHTRDIWFNNEIEKAFKVYSEGGEGGRYGYSVDSVKIDRGVWDAIYAQNRSSFEKVAGDYLQAHCRAEGIDVSTLTRAEIDRIRGEGLDHLRNQFDERMARREEIESIKADQQILMEMFAEKGLLERVVVKNPMYTGEETDDLEMLMNRLNHMANKILRDTGRQVIGSGVDWSATDQFDRAKMIPRETLVELTYQWYHNKLRYKPEVYDAVIKELQARLENNRNLGPTDISRLVEDTIKRIEATPTPRPTVRPTEEPAPDKPAPDKKQEKKPAAKPNQCKKGFRMEDGKCWCANLMQMRGFDELQCEIWYDCCTKSFMNDYIFNPGIGSIPDGLTCSQLRKGGYCTSTSN